MTNSPVSGNIEDDSGRLQRLEVFSDDPRRTQAIAGAVADLVAVGDLLVLTGDLGAGKTCFTQGLGRGLGVEERITSPTFTLANQYHGRITLHHLDVYRLDSLAETLDLDLPDLLESGVTVIEWGEQISEVLPTDHLLVALRYPDVQHVDVPGRPLAESAVTVSSDIDEFFEGAGFDDRVIEFVAMGDRWRDLLPSLARKLSDGDFL